MTLSMCTRALPVLLVANAHLQIVPADAKNVEIDFHLRAACHETVVSTRQARQLVMIRQAQCAWACLPDFPACTRLYVPACLASVCF